MSRGESQSVREALALLNARLAEFGAHERTGGYQLGDAVIDVTTDAGSIEVLVDGGTFERMLRRASRYELADRLASAQLDGDWMRRTKAIGINLAYTYCAPTASTCSAPALSARRPTRRA